MNEADIHECSHSEAAAALKGAGTVVTLVVEYRPAEFEEFQQRIQQLQEIQATSQEPSTPPGIKPSPVKQLYVRYYFVNIFLEVLMHVPYMECVKKLRIVRLYADEELSLFIVIFSSFCSLCCLGPPRTHETYKLPLSWRIEPVLDT